MLNKRVLVAALCISAVFSIGYVAQAFGPLRLGGWDSSEYLVMAAVKSDGYPFPKTRLPIGYPVAVVGLDRIGLANQAGFVVLNLIGLAIGLLAFIAIGRAELGLSAVELAAVTAATLLYRTVIELAAVPQPDLLFFGASMVALASFSRAITSENAPAWIATGAAALAVSVSLRSIGLALIPASAWAVCRIRGSHIRRALVGVALLVSWVAIAMTLVKWRGYLVATAAPTYRSMGTVGVLEFDLAYRFEELADLVTNTHFPFFHGLQTVAWIRLGAAVFGILALVGIWKSRTSLAAVYSICYFGILLAWPALMPRFWAPVAPFVFAFTWIGAKAVVGRLTVPRGVFPTAVGAYCCWICALGAYGMVGSLREARTVDGKILAALREQPHLTTADIARLNPEDLATVANVPIAASRFGK